MNARTKRMRSAILGAVGVLALGAVGVAARAEQAGPGDGTRFGRGRGPGRGPMHMARALDLTDDQQASLKALVEEHRKAVEPLREKHRELRQQVRQQLDGGSSDAAAIGRLTVQAHGVAKQLRESHTQMMERFKALLTDEQKTRLDALEKARGGRRPGFGRFGPGGPPEEDDEPGPSA